MPWDFYFFKLTQPLTHFFKLMQSLTDFFKLMQLLTYLYSSVTVYTVKEKVGKPDKNHTPFPMVSEIHTETSSLRTLKKLPRNLKELYVHEFGFRYVLFQHTFSVSVNFLSLWFSPILYHKGRMDRKLWPYDKKFKNNSLWALFEVYSQCTGKKFLRTLSMRLNFKSLQKKFIRWYLELIHTQFGQIIFKHTLRVHIQFFSAHSVHTSLFALTMQHVLKYKMATISLKPDKITDSFAM